MTAVTGVTASVARLDVRVPVRADPDVVAALLADPTAWLGTPVEPSPDGRRRVAADLHLRVSDRLPLSTFRKAAYVDLAPPRREGHLWVTEIGWRAASLAPLFPVFSGELTAHADRLHLRGWYAPPGGVAGLVADRLLLHVAASGTARWLLSTLADAAADRAASDRRAAPAGASPRTPPPACDAAG